jgi:SAM-dependent methyltransferase
MFKKLITKPVHSTEDIKAFFDWCARTYSEQHGSPDSLLNYRIRLIKQSIPIRPNDTVLDIGCGNGHHLFALANDLGRGIGIDLSSGMIAAANERLQASSWQKKMTFCVDNAEELSTVSEQSIDVALCIGAFEHMLNKSAVLNSIYRVLKPQGCFFCLTPNGDYLWYRFLAPLLRLDIKHLSTDKFLTHIEMERLLTQSGFNRIHTRNWTFIPKGDIHPTLRPLLWVLDGVGNLFNLQQLQGGLLVCAWKRP